MRHYHWTQIDKADRFKMSGRIPDEKTARDRASKRTGALVWFCYIPWGECRQTTA